MSRDPRVDPRPGDVIEHDGIVHTILEGCYEYTGSAEDAAAALDARGWKQHPEIVDGATMVTPTPSEPAPDYRAALEALERAASALHTQGAPVDQADDASIGIYRCCGRAEYRDHSDTCPWALLADALTLARKVLHGQ